MVQISKARFEALAGYIRNPATQFVAEELEHFASDDCRVLGIVLRDRTDDDYTGIVLGRDARQRFRAVDVFSSEPSRSICRKKLRERVEAWAARPAEDFFQGDEKGTPLDVFLPVVSLEKLHSSFLRVATGEAMSPGRSIIESMMPYFEDVDGNFVEQFQSTAFDARLWELYLFAALTEDGFTFDRTYQAPDYLCKRFGDQVFVEAVTVHPTQKNGLIVEPEIPTDPGELKKYLEEYMPFKWGSALTSKLAKAYWKQSHVEGQPIVLAIQDFHAPRAMTLTGSTLLPYLYGLSFTALYDLNGNLSVTNHKRETHQWGQKTIPSGFFSLPGAEHISAVLSNPAGTISKFNRMALLAGFGSPDVKMLYHGTCYDHDPNAAVPLSFTFEVHEPGYTETWTEGIDVYHNPNALIPLKIAFFEEASHHHFKNGEFVSRMADFHPYGSTTIMVTPDRLSAE